VKNKTVVDASARSEAVLPCKVHGPNNPQDLLLSAESSEYSGSRNGEDSITCC
jgi:hypothetical protein